MTKPAPARLWEKGTGLDAATHRFTVGDDPHWDLQLLHWDCLGSAAHARTLNRAGLLSAEELQLLLRSLAECDRDALAGTFPIPAELEDCHTAIEARLIAECGSAGEKIHTGRSRNDQVATAMRLFMRNHALAWLNLLADLGRIALRRARRDGALAMPGYTHMELAMPSSVGQWLHAVIEAALEQMYAGLDLLTRLDACPLGTGAGFGVPLPLDRDYTAALLGFRRVQRSPVDVQNSRGRMEKYFLRVAADIGALLEKLSCDMLLFASPAYGFFELPADMTTGSSIMPQKKNPDVLELLRARGARLRARLTELEWVSGKLPSGYHRDLQLTKEPAIRTAHELVDMLTAAGRVLADFKLNADRMAAALRPEIYATHAALDLVRQGMPFRQAYRQIGEAIVAGRFSPDPATVESADTGRVGESTWNAVAGELNECAGRVADHRWRHVQAEAALLETVD